MKHLVRTTVLFAIAGSASWLPSAVAADAAKDCIRGSVKMSASLTGEVKPGATLFVYAREAERSKGAPHGAGDTAEVIINRKLGTPK